MSGACSLFSRCNRQCLHWPDALPSMATRGGVTALWAAGKCWCLISRTWLCQRATCAPNLCWVECKTDNKHGYLVKFSSVSLCFCPSSPHRKSFKSSHYVVVFWFRKTTVFQINTKQTHSIFSEQILLYFLRFLRNKIDKVSVFAIFSLAKQQQHK